MFQGWIKNRRRKADGEHRAQTDTNAEADAMQTPGRGGASPGSLFLVPTSFQAFFRIDVKGLSGRERAFLYGMKSWSGKRT